MDKNAIKKYAVWARNELISRVTQKAEQYEITEKKTTPKDADSINGRLLTDAEKNQRKALIEKIQADGFEQVMEEVAYTWFNRFTALRFMEVNNYLPSHTRVFTNEAGEFKPQILADAIQLDLEGLDMDKVFELKEANKTEELYKYLLITQCNALSAVLPRMFQKIEHYTELLLPDYLLREGSVVEQMIALIPEEDWTDQVQIIGWLYQFYNIEPKDAVFAKKGRVVKEEIPAATQLFTPDWIVRYMVENSLGRLWMEGHPNETLRSEWKYYLDDAEQEADVQRQLESIRKEYANLKPEDIRCIDPCMGSGHILCYMFDVLVKIYEDYGYTAREAAENIVAKNLWGLDIDERAAQLSYFAVMMKARQYDRRFLTRGIQPHVYAIEESNGITSAPMHDMGIELSQEEYGKAVKEAMRLVEEMHDAKEYGSIISVTPCDWDLLRRFAIPREASEGQMRMDIHGEIEASGRLQTLINIGEVLAQKYNVVVTNPPYMPLRSMGDKINAFVLSKYEDSKTDLYSVFIERCNLFTASNGMQAMITMHSWMTLGSFENLRHKLLATNHINMAHLGSRAFEEIGGEVVQTCAWVQRNARVDNYQSVFVKLTDYPSQDEKEEAFFDKDNYYYAKRDKFDNIPGEPYSYWVSDRVLDLYKDAKYLADDFTFRRGITTGDNPRFLRLWQEVDVNRTNIFSDQPAKWYMYNKGGSYCKWYGNRDYVALWENDGAEMKGYKGSAVRNIPQQFIKNLSYSSVATGKPSFRLYEGFLNDQAGNFLTQNKGSKLNFSYVHALLNSVISECLIRVKNTTQNITADSLDAIPVILGDDEMIKEISELVENQMIIAKQDWDSFEVSWDYQEHPFVQIRKSIEGSDVLLADVYDVWSKTCDDRFERAKANEERINTLLLQVYGLQEELDASIKDKDISIHKANMERDVKSFISYIVGCMFGRYSVDHVGLVYAGGKWDDSKYISFIPDKDGIVPICDDEYFEDDIVGRSISFLKTVFGEKVLEDNLKFIASAIGGTGSARDILRGYYIDQFFKDHCTMYSGNIGKRPIYWLFDSGKKNGFKCLVYMHRYQSDTIARIRTDYVHEQQSRYRTVIEDIEHRISVAGTSERVKLNKHLQLIQGQAEELKIYEEKIHHLADQMISINLDDGVKHNYEIFKDVLAKIK